MPTSSAAGSIARLDLSRGLEAMALVLGAQKVLRPAGRRGEVEELDVSDVS